MGNRLPKLYTPTGHDGSAGMADGSRVAKDDLLFHVIGCLAASHCHVARAICRRAERSLVGLNREKQLNHYLMAYVNRLSDYLFVLARAISKAEGKDETYWQSARMKSED